MMIRNNKITFTKKFRFAPDDSHTVMGGMMERLNDRRVCLFPVEVEGEITHWVLSFKALECDRSITRFSMCLTDEAMMALHKMYAEQSPRLNLWREMMRQFGSISGALASVYMHKGDGK